MNLQTIYDRALELAKDELGELAPVHQIYEVALAYAIDEAKQSLSHIYARYLSKHHQSLCEFADHELNKSSD